MEGEMQLVYMTKCRQMGSLTELEHHYFYSNFFDCNTNDLRKGSKKITEYEIKHRAYATRPMQLRHKVVTLFY